MKSIKFVAIKCNQTPSTAGRDTLPSSPHIPRQTIERRPEPNQPVNRWLRSAVVQDKTVPLLPQAYATPVFFLL